MWKAGPLPVITTIITITEKILCIGTDAQDFVWFKKEILDKGNSLL